jgi:hypothetical protein
MSFERPITPREAVEGIERKRYLLPAIQGGFVWRPQQIECLFDSLMRNYPIGSFLFWRIRKEKSREYDYYEFMKDYREGDPRYPKKANVRGSEDITVILDGQQRLGALYIGLRGTYTREIRPKGRDEAGAFPERGLYLNLLRKSDEYGMAYEFRFLTLDEAKYGDEDTYWYRVGDILERNEPHEVHAYLVRNRLHISERRNARFATQALFTLRRAIHDFECVHYHLAREESLERVLHLFARVHRSGTQLSYSDLLLSTAGARWKARDVREEIAGFTAEINTVGDGFDFDRDFVLKTCLVLCDFRDIALKVDNLSRGNMVTLEKKWEDICKRTRLAINLVASFGYNRHTLLFANVLIPIAYYLFRKGLPLSFVGSTRYRVDRQKIRVWLVYSLLKGTFGGDADTVLRLTRQVIAESSDGFPLREIIEKTRGGTKSLVFHEDEIENLLSHRYGQSHTFSVLSLLYPSWDVSNTFHIDHVFPKGFFTRKGLMTKGIEKNKVGFYLDHRDCVANLQLIEGIPDEAKRDTDFKEWLYAAFPSERERRGYMRTHRIPDIDLSLDNFEHFIVERGRLIKNTLLSILEYEPHH